MASLLTTSSGQACTVPHCLATHLGSFKGKRRRIERKKPGKFEGRIFGARTIVGRDMGV